MTYSKSNRALLKVKPYLDQLVEASTNIEFEADEPSEFSYKLREGIYVASARAKESNEEPYVSYSRLKSKFILRTGKNKVIAELRDAVPIVSLRKAFAMMTLHDLSDEFELIGAAIAHKAPELFFPDADDDTCELHALYLWTSSNGYHIVVSEKGITLTTNEVGEVAWKPE